MTTERFEQRLQKLNPNLVILPHPGVYASPTSGFHQVNKDKAVVYLKMPDGKLVTLLVCEGDWMPEWTVMAAKEARVPYDKPDGYWVKTMIAGREMKRGWRTVLIHLLHKGLIGLEATEREFGAGQRESWKILTGKGTGSLII
jgi:hypothetical protein